MSDSTHQEFSQQNPLSFALSNFHVREDRNLLYINDNPDDLRFNLEIKNLSTQAITLNKSTQSELEAPNPNNYHIELKFRPNQLSQISREKIDLSEVSKEGWSISRPYENRDRTVSLFLLKRKDEIVIEKEGTKFITLTGLGANSTDGARVTQLEINYKDFYFAQEKSDENANTQRRAIDPQTQIIILTVLNYSGKREANLTVTFAYAPTLLNNGSDSEPIVLQIVNTGQDSITLNENSKFELTIDVEGERAEPWALAKKDEAKTYDVDIEQKPGNFLQSRESWIIEKPIESREDPTWVIRPNFGMIIMWSGAADGIPGGWALCSGDNNTPDLRDRFIVCAGELHKLNDKGDPDRHNHSISVPSKEVNISRNGSHSHRFPTAWYNRDNATREATFGSNFNAIDRGNDNIGDSSTQSNGDHTHSGNVSSYTLTSSSSEGLNRPKWYSLCFIIKI